MAKGGGPKQSEIFHGDPLISQKSYAKHKLGFVRQSADLNSMWHQLAPRAECPKCGAQPEKPCVSQAVGKEGQSLDGVHTERITAAKKKFGRKKR
jgi:hypothetical protein